MPIVCSNEKQQGSGSTTESYWWEYVAFFLHMFHSLFALSLTCDICWSTCGTFPFLISYLRRLLSKAKARSIPLHRLFTDDTLGQKFTAVNSACPVSFPQTLCVWADEARLCFWVTRQLSLCFFGSSAKCQWLALLLPQCFILCSSYLFRGIVGWICRPLNQMQCFERPWI